MGSEREPMRRRRFLVLSGTTLAALAGCTAGPGGSESDRTRTPGGTTGSSAPTGTPTSTGTPSVDRPAECPTSPNVEGLLERLDEPTETAVTSFVREYERTLILAREPGFDDVNYMEHVSTRSTDDGFRVHLYVVPLVAATPDEGRTASTSTPTTSHEYDAGYFVDAYRIVREERRSAVTYRFSPYDGVDPRDGGQLVQCRV